MKKLFIYILLAGIILGALRQRGATTGIRVVDSGLAAVDESLREYVSILESYLGRDEVGGGPSVTEMLGAAVETSPSPAGSESNPEEEVASAP